MLQEKLESIIILEAKVETCLELCDGSAKTFKKFVMKVTGLTNEGFHKKKLTDGIFTHLAVGTPVHVIKTTLGK